MDSKRDYSPPIGRGGGVAFCSQFSLVIFFRVCVSVFARVSGCFYCWLFFCAFVHCAVLWFLALCLQLLGVCVRAHSRKRVCVCVLFAVLCFIWEISNNRARRLTN